MFARRFIATTALVLQSLLLLALLPINAHAHQPVILTSADTTASKGPLLTDGTISFAVRASFSKSGERRAFRAAFNEGDLFSIQYLIVDKKPENKLRITALPTVLITSPTGKKLTMKIAERTKFYEPFSGTNYLYLARNSFSAEPGIYSILITAKGRAEVTIAIGDREVPGEVVRGELIKSSPTPTQTPTPTATPTKTPTNSNPMPTSSATKSSGYTLEMVKQNNSAASCWTIIDGYVYDLTKWISAHPGGAGAIRSLCGIDGSVAFKAQHQNQYRPEQRLESFQLGPLSKP